MSGQGNIKISFDALTQQSQTMATLKDEYDGLFSQVVSILNEMNDGWSENLANNFVGKISTAQKGFAKIVEMLECGSTVAKEASSGFIDVNSAMARQQSGSYANLFADFLTNPSYLGTPDPAMLDVLQHFSKQEIGNFGPIKDQLLMANGSPEMLETLAKLEAQVFGTDYLSQIQSSGNLIGDLLTGKISSDTIDNLSNLVDIGKIGEAIGFSDGTGMGMIIEGLKRTFGDGENIDTIDPAMIDLCDDWSKVQEAFSNGNYLEAAAGAFYYPLEASTEMVSGIVVDGVGGLVNNFMEQSGLDKVVGVLPLDQVNDQLKDWTGIDFGEFPSALAENMREEFGNRVDATVQGIPIVTEYIGEQIENGISSVGNLFEDIGSGIASWFK